MEDFVPNCRERRTLCDVRDKPNSGRDLRKNAEYSEKTQHLPARGSLKDPYHFSEVRLRWNLRSPRNSGPFTSVNPGPEPIARNRPSRWEGLLFFTLVHPTDNIPATCSS